MNKEIKIIINRKKNISFIIQNIIISATIIIKAKK